MKTVAFVILVIILWVIIPLLLAKILIKRRVDFLSSLIYIEILMDQLEINEDNYNKIIYDIQEIESYPFIDKARLEKLKSKLTSKYKAYITKQTELIQHNYSSN